MALEKAYDRVLRLTYINVVEIMYEGACIIVKNMCEETGGFRIRVGVHQYLPLSPYLFPVVMDEVNKEIQRMYNGVCYLRLI